MRRSQADLASYVGVSRQYMSELLARWNEEKIVLWNASGQHLLSLARLRAMLSPQDDRISDKGLPV